MIYLDNSATTRIDEEVLEAMLPWLRDNYGNASSIYSLGRRSRVAIEEARTEIARAIGAHPAELFFTSGGTESNNTVLKSACIESHLCSSLCVSAIEHHAILHPAEYMHSTGIPTAFVRPETDGIISPDALMEYCRPGTLFSIMHANNETGAIQPIRQIKDMMPQGAYLHTDAVQSFGKIPVNVQDLGVDFMTLSAHKIHGPKGIGALFIRKGIDFKAHQQGGGQERNRRAGTESPALIVGFQIAVRKAMALLQERAAYMRSLRESMIGLIRQHIPWAFINGPENPDLCLPSIVNISFPDAPWLDGEGILQMMDIHNIAVSNGSACVSGSPQPSHVLLAMGKSRAEAKAAIRFSFSKDTTMQQIEQAVHTLAQILESMKD
jgi:cysteine desulfurase